MTIIIFITHCKNVCVKSKNGLHKVYTHKYLRIKYFKIFKHRLGKYTETKLVFFDLWLYLINIEDNSCCRSLTIDSPAAMALNDLWVSKFAFPGLTFRPHNIQKKRTDLRANM